MHRMEMRRLGRNGPSLSRLGLGLAAIGRPAYLTLGHAGDFPEGRSVEAMEAHAHGLFDRAFDAGIRYFDAARSYGRAEEFLHSWIERRKFGPEEVVVGSKWGYRYTGDWQLDGRVQEVKEHSATMLRSQIAESDAILGPFLQLYQIHSAAPETGVLENAEVLAELRRLRERGLFLGVTATGPRQLETLRRAIELRFDGAPLFSAVQATWNLLERSAEPGLREAHQAGLAVIVKEALANGRLTAKGAEQADAVPPHSSSTKKSPLRAVAERLRSSGDAVALAFVLKEPWSDVVLLGAATGAQLDSNLRSQELRLSPEDVQALDALVEPAQDYWSQRSRLPWT
jgi:aryl-alcohol dehydrogenase-like predicted oxidoreductase